jgi:hypothetical protein
LQQRKAAVDVPLCRLVSGDDLEDFLRGDGRQKVQADDALGEAFGDGGYGGVG